MKTFLITGAAGELGHPLIEKLLEEGNVQIVSLDRRSVSEPSYPEVTHVQCDITDEDSLRSLFRQYDFDCIFHLAAILSSAGEKNPFNTHNVNVDGSLNLIRCGLEGIEKTGRELRFIFPSSIAAYGIPAGSDRKSVKENQYLHPTTMYGMNKLYIENIGHYFSRLHEKFVFATPRFPGLLSAFSLPSGGTSDFASHMIHSAVKGEPYSCYVSADLQLPYMVMPDAVLALYTMAHVPADQVRGETFNVTSFSLGPAKTAAMLKGPFPNFSVSYNVEDWRDRIIQSWPETLDDSRARKRWGWNPQYDLPRAFEEYLLPNVRATYNR